MCQALCPPPYSSSVLLSCGSPILSDAAALHRSREPRLFGASFLAFFTASPAFLIHVKRSRESDVVHPARLHYPAGRSAGGRQFPGALTLEFSSVLQLRAR